MDRLYEHGRSSVVAFSPLERLCEEGIQASLTWRGKSLGGGYENINLGYSQDQCCS